MSAARGRARPHAARPVPARATLPAPRLRPGSGRARRRTALTGRAAVLALVVCALALTLAYPLRAYLEQRGRIAELRDRTVAQERQVGELEAERDRWADPAFVRAQARDRLNYVLPGETKYVVLGARDGEPAPAAEQAPSRERQAWYGELWSSVVRAGADGR